MLFNAVYVGCPDKRSSTLIHLLGADRVFGLFSTMCVHSMAHTPMVYMPVTTQSGAARNKHATGGFKPALHSSALKTSYIPAALQQDSDYNNTIECTAGASDRALAEICTSHGIVTSGSHDEYL